MLWPNIVFTTIDESDTVSDCLPWEFYTKSIPFSDAGLAIISTANISVKLLIVTTQASEKVGRRASQRDAKRLTKMLHKFILFFVEKFSNSFGVQRSSSLLLEVVGNTFTEVLKQSVFGITSTTGLIPTLSSAFNVLP